MPLTAVNTHRDAIRTMHTARKTIRQIIPLMVRLSMLCGMGDRMKHTYTNETVPLPTGKLIRLVANASDVVICNDTGDIVTIEGTCCYVDGFTINGSGLNVVWPGYGGACINVTSEWNVVTNNHIYNRSGGIKLYGEKNLIRCNTVGDSANDRVCLCQMAISGDCNAIVRNTFDGDTAAHTTYGWILGGTFTDAGVAEADATATVKQFEVVTNDTMDPGIGYFVNVTTAGTWSYMGRCTSISVDLKPGLNCIGWGNVSEDISDALYPISGNYTYVARWDADDPKYEVCDANAPLEFIDFETMERGNGYWIAAKEGYTLNV